MVGKVSAGQRSNRRAHDNLLCSHECTPMLRKTDTQSCRAVCSCCGKRPCACQTLAQHWLEQMHSWTSDLMASNQHLRASARDNVTQQHLPPLASKLVSREPSPRSPRRSAIANPKKTASRQRPLGRSRSLSPAADRVATFFAEDTSNGPEHAGIMKVNKKRLECHGLLLVCLGCH